jgi:hypothetical protein
VTEAAAICTYLADAFPQRVSRRHSTIRRAARICAGCSSARVLEPRSSIGCSNAGSVAPDALGYGSYARR